MALIPGPHLSLTGVAHSFSGSPVVAGIDLALNRGEVLVLLGPSGCGKTTLLRLMAGLLVPDEGEVVLDGTAPVPGRGTAMVFQSYRLLPWKTVRDNVAFAVPHLRAEERDARVDAILRQVGLTRFAGLFPAALSGGMKQRTALARALVTRPGFLLMDEPYAALDAQARELMQAELLRLVAGEEAPGVVFVTHGVDEALMLGDRVLLLSPRPARILADIKVPFPAPRWRADPRDHPDYADLRRDLWARLRAAVLSDPTSDFHVFGSGP